MNFENQLLETEIKIIMDKYPHYELAGKANEEDLHQLLESVTMDLSGKLQLAYSRRGDLWKSFKESQQNPLFFFDPKNKSVMGALSETRVYKNNNLEESFYTSDLRMKASAPLRTKLDFRRFYQEIVSSVKGFCFTSILSDNIAAIKSLCSKRNPVSYNPLFEYYARTFLVLPSLRKSKLKVIRVDKTNQDEYLDFLNKTNYEFAHLNPYDKHYLVKDKTNSIVSCFSIYRPENRSLKVVSQSVLIRSALWFMKNITKTFKDNKLSWTYITHFVFDEKLPCETFGSILIALKKQKLIKTGELALLLHKADNSIRNSVDKKFFAGNLHFSHKASLFQVELSEQNRQIHGPVLLDPCQL